MSATEPAGTTAEEVPSVRDVREAARRAHWGAGKLATLLGVTEHWVKRLQRDGGVWPADMVEGVERVMVIAAAEERRLRIEAEALELMLAGWNADVRAWRAALVERGTIAAATIESYQLHVSWLARDLATTMPDPWTVPAHRVEAWIDEHNWSTSTRRKVMISLRSFFEWGVLDGRCLRSPVSGISVAPNKKSGPAPAVEYPQAWHGPMQRYQEHLIASGVARGTRKVYGHNLMNLARNFADPWIVTLEDLVRHLSRPDLAPDTRKTIRTSIRSFYRWAEDTGVMPAEVSNPAARLPTVRVPRSMPRPATDEAVLEALEKADARTHLAISIAVYTGARMGEVARIHARDIGDQAILLHGKGDKERLVPLHPGLKVLLDAELRRRREGGPLVEAWGPVVPRADGYLFPHPVTGEPITAGHMTRIVSEVLPGRWTGHTLRHRFATQAYAKDRDLRAVQELLGHASPTTTSVYAQVPGDSLLRAVGNVGPVTQDGIGTLVRPEPIHPLDGRW